MILNFVKDIYLKYRTGYRIIKSNELRRSTQKKIYAAKTVDDLVVAGLMLRKYQKNLDTLRDSGITVSDALYRECHTLYKVWKYRFDNLNM